MNTLIETLKTSKDPIDFPQEFIAEYESVIRTLVFQALKVAPELIKQEGEEIFSKLLESWVISGYKPLSSYKSESSRLTYLKTVISNFVIDEKRKEVGRPQKSKRIEKLGEDAVLFRNLLRDSSFNHATELLRSHFKARGRESELPDRSQLEEWQKEFNKHKKSSRKLDLITDPPPKSV